jgi:Ser/Thr protein kinase RdoA (MazF antagonist)
MTAGGSARDVTYGERRLATALARLEIEPVSVTTLEALKPWSRAPRTFEIATGEGERLKIRFARRARYAARAQHLTTLLGDPRIRPPVAVSGTAMVEHWVEGEPLSSVRLEARHVDAAADMLAAVHLFEPRAGLRATTRSVSRMRRQSADLVAAGLISRDSAARLERLVDRSLPPRASWGLTHGDFCDENIVVGADGTLSSVDNELFGFGFLDYDVARAWYRWPMPAWAENRFSRRYDATSGRSCDHEETQAWRAVATVKALTIRLRARSAADPELRALRRILADSSA